jgi:hypothetical protein
LHGLFIIRILAIVRLDWLEDFILLGD